MTLNADAQRVASQGIQLAGVPVTFQRISGFAPNTTTTTSAAVTAIVRSATPDSVDPTRTGYGSAQIGGISQDDRQVIVMASDLSAAGFPLPLEKNDKIIVTSTNEKLNITKVDAYKRALAGAIELLAAGVA